MRREYGECELESRERTREVEVAGESSRDAQHLSLPCDLETLLICGPSQKCHLKQAMWASVICAVPVHTSGR